MRPIAQWLEHVARVTAARPVLCQLTASMPSVLEHNVSIDTVGAFKARAMGLVGELAMGMHAARPERPLAHYKELIHHAVPLMVGLWPFANPSPVVREVLAAEELADFRHDFERDLRAPHRTHASRVV